MNGLVSVFNIIKFGLPPVRLNVVSSCKFFYTTLKFHFEVAQAWHFGIIIKEIANQMYLCNSISRMMLIYHLKCSYISCHPLVQPVHRAITWNLVRKQAFVLFSICWRCLAAYLHLFQFCRCSGLWFIDSYSNVKSHLHWNIHWRKPNR